MAVLDFVAPAAAPDQYQDILAALEQNVAVAGITLEAPNPWKTDHDLRAKFLGGTATETPSATALNGLFQTVRLLTSMRFPGTHYRRVE